MCIKNPTAVEEVARAYVEAGSDIILTNSFGANAIALARHGPALRSAEINRAAVSISLRAAGIKARVFGSIGPSGVLLSSGDVRGSELLCAFREQAGALAEAGAHGLVVETMSDIEEALFALRAARETGLPVAVSMAYDSGENGLFTMMGVHVREASRRLSEAGADIIGANCGTGIEHSELLTGYIREATAAPVWIKPNAGLPELVDGRVVYRMTPAEFASHAADLINAGASYIGGCCGTSPDHISAMRIAMDAAASDTPEAE
jgi:methionine synthase I (cobalamin-dependent)